MKKTTTKTYALSDKAAVLRRHLIDRTPMSALSAESGIPVRELYQWRRQILNNLEVALEGPQDEKADGESRSTADTLLEAAAAEFAKRGYEGTKIHHIVERAGLTTGAVYRQFKNKDDLLRAAVVSRAATVWLSGFDPDRHPRVADFLVGAGGLQQTVTVHMEMFLEALISARREPAVAEAVFDSNEVWMDSVRPLVQAGMQDGSIDPKLDIDSVAILLRVIGLGSLLYQAVGLPEPAPDAWAQLLQQLVRALSADGRPAESDDEKV